MFAKNENINSKKGKNKMGWIIVLVIVAIAGAAGAQGFSKLSR
jgi:flagellar basal body-associated protein FliL